MKYFFDTYALFEIYQKNPSYEKYMEEEITTTNLNLAELYYGFLKDGKKKPGLELFNSLRNSTIQVSNGIVQTAVEFRHKHKNKKLSYIDCIGYATAMEQKLIFLTGDEQFKAIEGVEFIK